MARKQRALVTGWFSFEHGEATAGDLLAGEAVRRWLVEDAWDVDVATSGAFPDGVDWRRLSPDDYELLVFTCGPLKGWQIEELIERFVSIPRVAVDVSLVDRPLAERFAAVISRDGDGPTQPDISLAVRPPKLPVIGVINTHPQPAYGKDRAEEAAVAVSSALRDYPAAVISLDTRVDPRLDAINRDPRSCAEAESLIARVDVMVTSRLHGLVLALRNGVPTVAIDVMPGGGKVKDQARVLGWPHVIGTDDMSPERIRGAIEVCLHPDTKAAVAAVATRWPGPLEAVRGRFLTAASRALSCRPV